MPTTIVPSSTLGPIPGATGGATQSHLVYAAYSGRWWFFTWSGVLDSGTATGAGQSTAQLVDTSKTWTASQFLGASCILTGGTGVGQVFEIGANTATALPVQDNGVAGAMPTAPVAGSTTYQIVETRNVRAWVSSGPDLATATWAPATGAATPNIANNTGIDMSGGSNNAGKHGEFPTDGRLLAVGYAPLNGVDVVMLLTQQNLHWQHLSMRGRLGAGAPNAVAWESTGPSTWDNGFPGNECEPTALQALAIANSSTGRWHSVQGQNTFPLVGYPSTVIDSGAANMALAWGGTRASMDTSIPFLPWQAALAALAGGLMLAVYCNGTYDNVFGAGTTHNTGLRYAESATESTWPTTNVGVSIPGLSSASNHPNDWGMVARTNADVHVVRRNSATTIEHVRYSGHGGSWGAVVALPSSGLTGHLQGSGLPLVTDGTNVWCVAIDTDPNSSVRYLRWTPGGGWDASWSTLSTGSESKNFLTATMRPDGRQIGVAYTTPSSTGFSGPPAYQVAAAALQLPDPPRVGGVGLSDPALSPQMLPGSPYAPMLWAQPLVEQPPLGAAKALVGTSASTSTATATASSTDAVSGTATSTSTAAATLTVTAALSGTSTSASSAAATPTVAAALVGTSQSTSSAAATPSRARPLAGTSSSTSSTPPVAAALADAISGTSTSASTASGNLTKLGQKSLAGTSASSSTATATPSMADALAGTSASASSASGNLTRPGQKALTGTSVSAATLLGTLAAAMALSGNVQGTSSAFAVLGKLIGGGIHLAPDRAVVLSGPGHAAVVGRGGAGAVPGASGSRVVIQGN